MTPGAAEMQEAFAELRAEYLEELPDKLRRLVEVLADARRAPGDAALRREARSWAHQLHGSGGSYGFASFGAAAGRIEDALAAVDAGELSPAQAWPGIDGALAEATAALAEATDGGASGRSGGGPPR